MDALSEVLRSVRLTGAAFFTAEFRAPWGFTSPPMQAMASSLAPGTYSVRVGWYDPVTGDRLQVGDEDMITLEELSVGSR